MLLEIGQYVFKQDRINGTRVYSIEAKEKVNASSLLDIDCPNGFKCMALVRVKFTLGLALQGDGCSDRIHDEVYVKFISKGHHVGSRKVEDEFTEAVYEKLKVENSSEISREIGKYTMGYLDEVVVEVVH
ncbi:MAG: hypothetical protein ACRDDH_11720 [Cetobacterium sp.]|uniref:hypothetical protein n=1 Tax=Cetobacterium sp. TaxID=2071632 RepID=UPI003EE46BEC